MASGAPKTSKLAALAAARKKKEEERKARVKGEEGEEEGKATSIALLDRLSDKFKDSSTISGESLPEKSEERPHNLSPLAAYHARKYRSRQEKEQSSEKPTYNEKDGIIERERGTTDHAKIRQELRALPSTFAATITRNDRISHHSSRRSRESSEITIPIKNHAKSATCTDKDTHESKTEVKSSGLTS